MGLHYDYDGLSNELMEEHLKRKGNDQAHGPYGKGEYLHEGEQARPWTGPRPWKGDTPPSAPEDTPVRYSGKYIDKSARAAGIE